MTMTGAELVASIVNVGVGDIPLLGYKAAMFATGRRAGFSVPEGVVLTTEALADALVAAGLHDGARQAAIEARWLPTNLRDEVATAVERLGSYRLSVRSSGVEKSRGPDRIGWTW